MNILKLTLTKQWFDLILNGKKEYEYREYKKHWVSRFLNKNSVGERGGLKSFNEIHFTNGYGSKRPFMSVQCLGVGVIGGSFVNPENGEPIDEKKNILSFHWEE